MNPRRRGHQPYRHRRHHRTRRQSARAEIARKRARGYPLTNIIFEDTSEAILYQGRVPVELRKSRTAFVIAHRLGTIRRADMIVVLEAGEIVQRGTHDELMAAGGRYKELHDMQYGWETERYVNPGECLTVKV